MEDTTKTIRYEIITDPVSFGNILKIHTDEQINKIYFESNGEMLEIFLPKK